MALKKTLALSRLTVWAPAPSLVVPSILSSGPR